MQDLFGIPFNDLDLGVFWDGLRNTETEPLLSEAISLADRAEVWPETITIRREPVDLRPDALDMHSLERELNRKLGNDAARPG